MIDPRVVQPVTRVMPKGPSAAAAAAEPARDGATTTPHALPPGLAGNHFVSEDLLIIETPSDKRPSAVPDLPGVDQVVPDDK
jgi:hypothetical protein